MKCEKKKKTSSFLYPFITLTQAAVRNDASLISFKSQPRHSLFSLKFIEQKEKKIKKQQVEQDCRCVHSVIPV